MKIEDNVKTQPLCASYSTTVSELWTHLPYSALWDWSWDAANGFHLCQLLVCMVCIVPSRTVYLPQLLYMVLPRRSPRGTLDSCTRGKGTCPWLFALRSHGVAPAMAIPLMVATHSHCFQLVPVFIYFLSPGISLTAFPQRDEQNRPVSPPLRPAP